MIDVPAAITLDELHEVLQVALGWTDSHLHQFRTETTVYTVPFEEWDDGEGEVDERGVPLSALPPSFVYAYDLGDGWEHDVEVLGPGGELPGCVDGAGRLPAGGLRRSRRLRRAARGAGRPAASRAQSMRPWVGDRLRPFDQDATAQRVREAVGAVPGSVRLLLDLLVLPPTASGSPPAVGYRARWSARFSSSDRLVPAGPARLDRGRPAAAGRAARHAAPRPAAAPGQRRATPTKAAADEIQTVRRLRSWFPPQQFSTVVAERAAALVAARGPMTTPKSPPKCCP